MKYVKLAVFWLLVVPMAFLWDCLFGLFGLLNKGMIYVDKKGGEVLEDIKDRLTQ